MNILSKIRGKHMAAKLNCCSDEGCKLNLAGCRNYVILKGELINSSIAICDCMIFFANAAFTVAIIELRSKSIDVEKIKKKMENGTSEAKKILDQCGIKDFELYLILLAKGYSGSVIQRIKGTKIKIEGKTHRIIAKRCGNKFTDIVI